MDKNYILKEVQLSLRDTLLRWMVQFTREYYQLAHNPLGLVDDTIKTVRSSEFNNVGLLYQVYAKIAAVYRHTHGEVQLEFLFNGDEHFDKYEEEWQEHFKTCISAVFEQKVFLQAVMEITVFKAHTDHQLLLINNRLQSHIEHFFNLRIYRYKGIVNPDEAQVA